ncbi:MAG TPA: long-chain-fatty-acid--CoA ligase [Steroidobacteraceae bacterium]|jgi:fatty-acyl-CoA synthase|nr:long-chain-fatty-acid--CoA ligase [Steroidobacteraceae bacterium]
MPLTPLEFGRRARKLYPHREAVVDNDERFTYEEFLDRCDRWSSALQRLGVAPGDRVAVISPNTHATLEAFYAIPQIGASIVPLNYRLAAEDFFYMLDHSGASVVCVHCDHVAAIDSIRDRLPGVRHFIALGGPRPGWRAYESLITEASSEFRPVEIAESDVISINYTSGTTSRPKGVMITHRNAWMNSVGALVHHPMSSSDRYLWTLPMFHANGWTYVWTVTAAGATHVCLKRAEPAQIYAQILAEQVTVLCAAPTVLIGIANGPEETRRQLPRGMRVITAGAPPAPATIQRIEDELGWRLTHVYGLTETAPFITVCEPRPEHAALDPRESSIIKARQGVELITSGETTVVDESGREVPRDGTTLGEIVTRGNVVMQGYYNDPEATADALRGGWFHTGDAAVVHPDGYIEIRDRFKDVIISGGENISSIEVEGALLQHPAVLEVAVVGVHDEKWGETPHAFIVLRNGTTASVDDLRQFARSNLAHFKVPSVYSFVQELPKTATGKIQKYVLRKSVSAIGKQ